MANAPSASVPGTQFRKSFEAHKALADAACYPGRKSTFTETRPTSSAAAGPHSDVAVGSGFRSCSTPEAGALDSETKAANECCGESSRQLSEPLGAMGPPGPSHSLQPVNSSEAVSLRERADILSYSLPLEYGLQRPVELNLEFPSLDEFDVLKTIGKLSLKYQERLKAAVNSLRLWGTG